MSKTKNTTITWAEKCKKSGGTSHLLPKNLTKDAKEIFDDIAELDNLSLELSKKKGAFQAKLAPFWHNVRTELDKGGCKFAFTKSMIDFDKNAKEDGVFVINLLDENEDAPMGIPGRPRPMQM